MATTTLRFTGPGSTTLPARLRFGDEDDAPPPTGDATLTLVAAVTSLQGSVPIVVGTRLSAQAVVTALSGAVGLQYVSDTQRPTVGAAHAEWQGAKAVPKAFTARYQRAQALALLQRPNWQVAQPTSAGITPRWADAGRAARLLVETGWHAAQPLRAARLHSLWEDATRLRAGARTGWNAALQMSHAPTRQGYQDADRTCRRWVHEAFANAWHLRRAIRDSGTSGLPVRTARGAPYQEAWPPRPGRWVRPVQPPMPGPCYVPSLPVRLVFSEAGLAGVLQPLRFFCERHGGGPQPGTVIVPIRRVSIVINTITLHRVDTGAQLRAHGFNASLDFGSWTWSWSASLHHDAEGLLGRDSAGDTAELHTVINGVPLRLRLESVELDERFLPQKRWAVSGQGKSSILGDSRAPILSFGNAVDRTAQQLAADALTINGVGIGWSLDWGIADWLVPAGAWALQGRYIDAINDIAAAAGGYVQPHPTDAVLRVLPRYPLPPWEWGSVTPDFEIPRGAAEVVGTKFVDKPAYNGVYVGGESVGVSGPFKRTGTDGAVLAPQVNHALITHADVHRARGIAEISDTGAQEHVTLSMQVLPETGLVVPGQFVRYVGDRTVMGIVRRTSIDLNRPKLRQTIAIETHVAD